MSICVGVWIGSLSIPAPRFVKKKTVVTNVNILSHRNGFTCDFLDTVPCLVCSLTCIKHLIFVLDLNSLNWIVANGATGSRNVELRDGRLVKANFLPFSRFKPIARTRAINIRESLRSGANMLGYLGGGGCEDITAYDGKVEKNFADFTVGRDEVSKRAKVARGCGWYWLSGSTEAGRMETYPHEHRP